MRRHVYTSCVLMVILVGVRIGAGPIHEAARKGDVQQVAALLDANAAAHEARVAFGETPLIIAAQAGLAHLDIPVAVFVPQELLNLATSLTKLVSLHKAINFSH